MKKIIGVFLVILAVILTACTPLDTRPDKQTVVQFVQEQNDSLLKCIEANNFSDFLWPFPVESIDVYEDHVDFPCGGAGFGSQTAYNGFFYSPKNDPCAVWCSPGARHLLTVSGDGFSWAEENGDNRFYVEMICEGFYYYEASF